MWLERKIFGLQNDGSDEESERPPKRKRYASRYWMDQFDCKFGVKFVDEDVLLMSDESVISSLNDEEIEHVKRVFEKVAPFFSSPVFFDFLI